MAEHKFAYQSRNDAAGGMQGDAFRIGGGVDFKGG